MKKMKTLHWTTVIAATAALSSTGFAAEQTETPVAFRVLANNHYVTTVNRGGLNMAGRAVGVRQSFVLIDLNGGDLADGDTVQIKWAPAGAKPTYWHESETGIDRIGGKPNEACTFTVKLKGEADNDAPQNVLLKTAGGKFVAAPTTERTLGTTEAEEQASTLEIVENAAPPAAE